MKNTTDVEVSRASFVIFVPLFTDGKIKSEITSFMCIYSYPCTRRNNFYDTASSRRKRFNFYPHLPVLTHTLSLTPRSKTTGPFLALNLLRPMNYSFSHTHTKMPRVHKEDADDGRRPRADGRLPCATNSSSSTTTTTTVTPPGRAAFQRRTDVQQRVVTRDNDLAAHKSV